MFIISFMNCLTCIAACLRIHYLISQSACQKMMKYCNIGAVLLVLVLLINLAARLAKTKLKQKQ